MATLKSGVSFRAGSLPKNTYAPSGHAGDWQTFNVAFQPAFPAAAAGMIRVVASATDVGVDPADHLAPAVPLVGMVSPTGCTIWARSSDVSRGSSGMNWIAIAETADNVAQPKPRLRMGTLLPQHFQVDGSSGDWRRWFVSFGTRVGFETAPVVVATNTNINVRVHAAAGVEVVGGASKAGCTIATRNSDVTAGVCNFNYMALQMTNAALSDSTLIVDTGEVPPKYFSVTGNPGDWQTWAITFAEPFQTPPVVCATAVNEPGAVTSYSRAVVATAMDISTDGFILAGRNSDVSAGPAGFAWVATGVPASL